MHSFSIAKYNAILYIIISKFHWNIWLNWKTFFWILFKNMFLNVIDESDIECHWKIWFWMVLKVMILNFIERYAFEFHFKKYFKNIWNEPKNTEYSINVSRQSYWLFWFDLFDFLSKNEFVSYIDGWIFALSETLFRVTYATNSVIMSFRINSQIWL